VGACGGNGQGGHKGRPYKERTVHHRRSIRLKGYDYSQAGAYFVTICTQDRICLFGEVADDRMRLNGAGEMAVSLWQQLPTRFPDIEIDAFIVMPNHLHGIIVLPDGGAAVGAPLVGARNVPTLGHIIGAFKSAATVAYVRGVKSNGWPEFRQRLWLRNYYEHVVRDETALNRIRQYIDENPARWAFDDENPNRTA